MKDWHFCLLMSAITGLYGTLPSTIFSIVFGVLGIASLVIDHFGSNHAAEEISQ